MKELSLNVLDVTENSVTAGAKNIGVSLIQDEAGILTIRITDDGCGMSEEVVARVTDPFTTSRTTRKVGLGLPLLKLASEQTGGHMEVESKLGEGTTVTATFDTGHIDFTPVGDMISTMTILIMGSPDIDFLFIDRTPEREVRLDTKELRAVLGDEVSLGSPDVIAWIKEYLSDQYNSTGGQDQ
ncbi:MAG: sensor histidine kinase [Clostridia bacterium]|nr:sensor histidine kinase [Clostridia bacterium]